DFTNANYRHATTFTGPGHASIGTGRTPSESGIVGNNWLERDAPFDAKLWDAFFADSPGYTPATKVQHPQNDFTPWWIAGGASPLYCTTDNRVRASGGATAGMSPTLLASDSLGDRVK